MSEPRAYWKANLDLASVVPELDVYDRNWPIHTYVESLPSAKFVQDRSGGHGMTMNSLVSGGCIISGSVVVQSGSIFPEFGLTRSVILIRRFYYRASGSVAPAIRRCGDRPGCVIPEGR